MESNTIFIHSKRMVGWLLMNGITHYKVVDDKKHIGKNVYLYHKSDYIASLMERMPYPQMMSLK
ncbi:hypothetical protein [Paenibacillus macquariensis]|uniref:DUF5659 domain-containing protein n=1 Tax=Paenibacillus macquariensis TaxID=948756 RepID=A0ABY1JKF5_9BACL|nr:hypothetical protein [Paenibacillus macquariensis]MEC0089925.1 hypothetical protein [Paenibacillus macquariensis]OAB31184.1 hypothetical protein PMSM_20920 [Paenibacillus macquariensis subsp. macquariensis]SIQ34424.1 hypothetical protein SAMN05421578_101311 [Paenibacillus macquariensis]